MISYSETGNSSKLTELRSGTPPYACEELQRGETLSEIGHKFGHEVGNPLTAIISLASILGRTLPPGKEEIEAIFLRLQKEDAAADAETNRLKLIISRLPEYANSITQEAWRISALTETLVFLLSERANPQAASEAVKSVTRALSKLNSRAHIRKQLFDLRVPANAPELRVEQDQLVYALGELCSNAAQAVTDLEVSPEGAVVVELRTAVGSSMARIAVRNPISRPCPFELPSVFKPFVTEYGARKQLGLGLPTVYSIVNRHGGSIEVAELRDDAGRLYFEARLDLPSGAAEGRSAAAPRSESSRIAPSTPAAAAGAGSAKQLSVLIVEDESSVATAIERILGASLGSRFTIGCTIVAGDESLTLLADGHRFDLILCDLNLHGTSGRNIFEAIQRDFPAYAQRFVFLTGERSRKEVIRYLESTRCPYLLKPFDASELEEVVLALVEKEDAVHGPA